MKLLALDQASITTGYAIFEDGELKDYGTVVAKKNLSFIDRLIYIKDAIFTLIENNQIDEVIFEDIQLENNNVATFKLLAELYGVIDYELTINNIPHSSVLAIQWRSTLGIKNAQRKQAKANDMAYIFKKYNVEVSDDIADAICIGAYYYSNKENPNDWTI